MTCKTQLKIKHIIITECHQYDEQRQENNIPDILRSILIPQIEVTKKYYKQNFFL